MAITTKISGNELHVSQEFDADPRIVFDCWFESCKVFVAWCHSDCESVRLEIDPIAGGHYKRFLNFGESEEVCSRMTFSEFDRSTQIAYFGRSSTISKFSQSVKTSFVQTRDGGTCVALHQTGAKDEDKLQNAIFGRTGVLIATEDHDLNTNEAAWIASFQKLESLLQQSSR